MSRKPDYRVAALDKVRDRKSRKIGAAWISPYTGHITVVLDEFIVLHGGSDLVITLFKGDEEDEKANDTTT